MSLPMLARRVSRFFRLTWLSRVPLGFVSPGARKPRAKQPPRTPVRLSLDRLEARETPDDLFSVLRYGISLEGVALLSGQFATPLGAFFSTWDPAHRASLPAPTQRPASFTASSSRDPGATMLPLVVGASATSSLREPVSVPAAPASPSPRDPLFQPEQSQDPFGGWLDDVGSFLGSRSRSASRSPAPGSTADDANRNGGGGGGPGSPSAVAAGETPLLGGMAPLSTSVSPNFLSAQADSTTPAPIATSNIAPSATTSPLDPTAPATPGNPSTPNEQGVPPAPQQNERNGPAHLARSFGRTQLPFEVNVGQSDPQVRFLSRSAGFGFWLTADEMVFAVPRPAQGQGQAERQSGGRDVFRLKLVGANPDAETVGRDELRSRSNYFVGSDSSQWHTNVTQYGRVEHRNVFPGIDLALHSRTLEDRVFEYDFVVQPGADPADITVRWEGLRATSIDGQGRLLLHTGGGTVVQEAPILYQESKGVRTSIPGRVLSKGNGEFGFEPTGEYDRTKPLVIDPAIAFATYLGGSGNEYGNSIAVDPSGNTYVTGLSTSSDFPTENGFLATNQGYTDAFVTKLNVAGDEIVYSTYLGGGGLDAGWSIAVDLSGFAYVTGYASAGFPTTAGAFQTSALDYYYNPFVTKLNATGDGLAYSTYVSADGNSEQQSGTGIAVDAEGYAYITGYTEATYFPTTVGAFQTSIGSTNKLDAFVTKVNRDGTNLVYSSYLGGYEHDEAFGIALDRENNAYVTGYTLSSDFPTTVGALQTSSGGDRDAFVAKVNGDGSALSYGTYLGGDSGDFGNAIAVDYQGRAWVTGTTGSTDLPTTGNAYQGSLAGLATSDAFLIQLNDAGTTLVYGSYLGGISSEVGSGIAVDARGYATVVGRSNGSGFPTTSGAIQSTYQGGVYDGFVTRFTPTGTLSYSTYLGGSEWDILSDVALDPRGFVYVVGTTGSSDLPTANAIQPGNAGGGNDAFVAKLLPIAAPRFTGISTDSGYSATDRVTTYQNLTLTGTVEAYATVTLERAGVGVIGSVQANSYGTFTYDYSGVTLPEGTHAFVATAESSAGKSDYSAPEFLVNVDRSAPDVYLYAASSTPSRGPEVRVLARDRSGVPATATVTLDVDLNNDGDFLDASESGYATGNLADGYVTLKVPTLSTTGTYPMRARVTDLAGNAGTSTTSTVVVSSVTSAWTATPRVLSADPAAGDTAMQLGDVTLRHPLDIDKSPGMGQGGNLALVYHSSGVAQKPIVQVSLPSVNNAALPATVTARLTFNGTAGTSVTYSTTGFAPGDVFTFALQASNAITTTGRYGYSVLVQIPGQSDQTVTGSTFVVAQDSSALGAGWTLAGVDRLVSISADANGPAGKLRVYGSGGWRFYEGTSTYTSPEGDNGTLSVSGATYTYSTPDGQAWTFNSSGYLTKWASADTKETLQYRYDGSNRLTGITSIDGALATLTYATVSMVSTVKVQAENSRTTTLTLSVSGDLTKVTNPDGGLHTLTYDGSHRLTQEQFSGLENNWAYTSSGTVGTYTWGAAAGPSKTTYQPARTRGKDALVSGTVFASRTDPTGHTTRQEMDERGRTLQSLAADGALDQTSYSSGYMATQTDPLGRVTTYTRDGQGYVTKTTLPDGSVLTYQYQSAFHALTTMVNELGNATTYAYDGSGHRIRSTDALGNHTTYNYDATTGLLESVVDPRGGTTTYQYDSYRRTTRVTDALGNGTSYGYDANGNRLTTTDALGRVTTTSYDTMGRLTSTRDPQGNITTTTYDLAGRRLTTTDPSGLQTGTVYDTYLRGLVVATRNGVGSVFPVAQLTSYDDAGRTLGRRDANGWWTNTRHDAAGRVIETTDALQGTTESVYDEAGDLIAERDQVGRWTTYESDSRGRRTVVEDSLGNRTTSVYDQAGNLTATTDPLSHTTTYQYDAADRRTVEIDPLGRRTTTTYDPSGNVLTVTDAMGRVTSTTYDALGRTTKVTEAVGTAVQRTRETSYDEVSNVTTNKDGLNNVTTYTYDTLSRRTEVIDPQGKRTTATYDVVGNRTTTKGPLGLVYTYSYDVLHRPVGVTEPLGNTTTSVLDARGKSAATIDPQKNVPVVVTDALGRTIGRLDQVWGYVYTVYDGAGAIRMLADPEGNPWHYVVDDLSREIRRIDPAGEVTTTAYDAVGRVTEVTDRNSRVMQYSYDDAGRQTAATWKSAAGATVNLLTYAYDARDNKLTAKDANGAVTYTYDELNRVKTYANVFGQVLTYAYDSEDHVTRREDSLGGVLTSTYDARGLLTSRQFGGVGQTPVRVDFGYTDRKEQSSITRYTDLAGTSVLGTSVYSYDDAGHLTGIVNKDNASTTLSYYTYTYDSVGRIDAQSWWSQVGTTTYSGTRAYGYDAVGQLVSDGTSTYGYDFNGNRTNPGYEIGVANRLTNDGVYTYAYDDEGNLTQKSVGTGQETWFYTYDHANRLTGVRETSDGMTNVLLLTYTYDVEGKRVEEQSWDGGGTTQTRFAYDGDDIWADLDSGNAVTARRLFGDRPDQVLTRTVSSGPNAGLWAYQTDAQGGVRDLVNASSQVKAHLDYDGFGVRTDPQSTVSDRYGYTGREWQADAGLQFNRRRDLDVGTGRWMQEDPIKFAGGDYNLVRYVGNDPVNRTDPSGLLYVPPPVAVGVAYAVVEGEISIGALMFGTGANAGLVGVVGGAAIGGADSVSAAARNPRWWPALLWISQALAGVGAVAAYALGAGNIDTYGGPGSFDQEFDTRNRRTGPCFAAGTSLLTPQGSKPIEQFMEGDLVLSRDEDDPFGEVRAKAVQAVFRGDAYVLELRVGGRVIRTTTEHPFWVAGKGWLPASSLAEGDRLLTHDGKEVAVEQVAQTLERTTVYNLRIADFHTYFVGCEEWGFSVWAHNACVVKGGLGPPRGLYNPYNVGWKIDTFMYQGVELTGTSAQSAPGLTAEELSRYLPNEKVRVTTTESIVDAGGTIEPTPFPDRNLPYHVTITGLTLEQLDALFARPIPNPG